MCRVCSATVRTIPSWLLMELMESIDRRDVYSKHRYIINTGWNRSNLNNKQILNCMMSTFMRHCCVVCCALTAIVEGEPLV